MRRRNEGFNEIRNRGRKIEKSDSWKRKFVKMTKNFRREYSVNWNWNGKWRCTIQRSIQWNSKSWEKKKTTVGRENSKTVPKIWQEKIQWIPIEMTRRAAEFKDEFNEIRNRSENGRKKKREFLKFERNFPIWEEKIQSIRSEMRRRNGELNGELNEIRLKIQFELKIGEKNKKQPAFEREN